MEYVADQLWVQAAGKNFAQDDKNHTPTYPRWHEAVNPKPKSAINDVKTENEVIDMFRKGGKS